MESAALFTASIVATGLALGGLLRRLLRSWLGTPFHASSSISTELRGEEVAFLRGGRKRLIAVVIARLRRGGHLSFDSGQLRPGNQMLPDEAPEVDQALAKALRLERNLDLGAVRRAMKEPIASIHGDLSEQGLALHGPTWLAYRVAGSGPLLLGAAGLFAYAFRLPRDHEDLPVVCVGAMISIATAIYMQYVGSPATTAGKIAVKEIAATNPLLPSAADRDRLDPESVAIHAAIHGEPYWGPDVARFLSGAGALKDEGLNTLSPNGNSGRGFR